MHYLKTSAHRPFVEYLFDRYPALKGSTFYRRLIAWLIFGTFHDRETNHLLIPHKMLAQMAEVDGSNFNSGAGLLSFQKDVLPWFRWSNQVFVQGKARAVEEFGWDDETRSRIDLELGSFDRKSIVDLVSGMAVNGKERLALRVNRVREHNDYLSTFDLNGCQRSVIDYLHQLNPQRIVDKMCSNQNLIAAAIDKLPPDIAIMQRRILASAYDCPEILYAPSIGGKTVRLTGIGDSICGLKKGVRKALCKDWTEVDLRSSQFAIMVAMIEVMNPGSSPNATKCIEDKANLWDILHQFSKPLLEMTPEDKAFYKTAIYSICFGKSRRNLQSECNDYGLPELLQHPIISELFRGRGKILSLIERSGGRADAFGVRHTFIKGIRDAHQILATMIQSIELRIVEAFFACARANQKSQGYEIVLFLHDGIVVSFQNKEAKPRALECMRKAVEKRADSMLIKASIDWNDL